MPEMPEFPIDMHQLLAGGLLGAAATLLLELAGESVQRWRRRSYGPMPKAQIHIFDAEGDHLLSAKLPTPAIQRLLEEFNAGRHG